MLVHTSAVFIILIGFISTAPLLAPSDDGTNYELLGGGFEGDMILPDGFDPTKETDEKGVAIFGPRRWPNNVVPYDIALITDAGHRSMIETAMRLIENATSTPVQGSTSRKPCVTFRPKLASDRVFVKIQYGTGCSASVGYSTGEKRVTLQSNGCFRSGTIQHEFLHSLGFYHEQSRPDRDNYITVNYANIQEGKEHNFNKYVWGTSVLNQNMPYDLGSIMHYSAGSFSSNGQPTITAKQSGVTMGQRDKLSATDIDEIRDFYSCTS